MRAVAYLLQAFSYLFHLLLSLFLLAAAALAYTGPSPLALGILPWTGTTLLYIVAAGGAFGLISTLLAVLGKLRLLFLLWNLAVVVFLIRGYASFTYRFSPGESTFALYFTLGALVALLGAWSRLRRPAGKARVYRTK